MIDKKAKVTGVRDLGSRNFLLTLSSPEQARLTRPGQFVMVKCAEDMQDNPLLRRPFSVFNIRRNSRSGTPAGIELLVKNVGAGTRRLAMLGSGDEIQVLGPQGRPFDLRRNPERRVNLACLVAGGVGIAALYLLARDLIAQKITPMLFYGGRSAGDLVLREYFEELKMETLYTSEDGSLGTRGMVTDALGDVLRSVTPISTQVYACGPWGMMKAAHETATRRRIPCQVSLEARMGCSLGACMGCVIRSVDSSGEEQYLRVCLEGPIMDSQNVDWNTPPF